MAALKSSVLKVALRPDQAPNNPYSGLFAGALERQGLSVHAAPGEAHWLSRNDVALLARMDRLVIHWPNEFLAPARPKKVLKAMSQLIAWRLLKTFRGLKLIWVVHNLAPHDAGEEGAWLGKPFIRCVDGLLFLSEESRRLALLQYPELSTRPFAVISHGHYRDVATSPASEPPPLADRPAQLALVGRIQPYKGAEPLAALAAGASAEDLTLTICGACSSATLEAELRETARRASNVQLKLGWMTDAQIEDQIDRSDAIVLPYRAILNSGSALLALSRGRPVMAPRIGGLVELQSQVGENWLYLYGGELTREVLSDFLVWLRARSNAPGPDLSAHDWTRIGRLAADFLGSL